MKKEKKTHGSLYFLWGVICTVLICLKVTKVITWSWALVLLPLYVPAALIFLVVIIVAAVITAREINVDK